MAREDLAQYWDSINNKLVSDMAWWNLSMQMTTSLPHAKSEVCDEQLIVRTPNNRHTITYEYRKQRQEPRTMPGTTAC